MRVQLWHATIAGGTFGLFVGAALQIARKIRHERDLELIAEQFQPWSPPLLVDLLRPHAIPVATCIAFAALASFIYVFWLRRQ